MGKSFEKHRGLDFIGDIHGCYFELMELLSKLGYDEELNHPEDRIPVLLGDITDRGPYNRLCLEFAYKNWESKKLVWIQGNHDNKLFRWMKGNNIQVGHGLQKTIDELEDMWTFNMERNEFGSFLLENIPTKVHWEDVMAVHASPYNNPMYGRDDWWETYEGKFAVFGHYWVKEPMLYSNACCVDTSCCVGGRLTALRWPEKDFVSVQAKEVYYESTQS